MYNVQLDFYNMVMQRHVHQLRYMANTMIFMKTFVGTISIYLRIIAGNILNRLFLKTGKKPKIPHCFQYQHWHTLTCTNQFITHCKCKPQKNIQSQNTTADSEMFSVPHFVESLNIKLKPSCQPLPYLTDYQT